MRASIMCTVCWRRPATDSTLISCEHHSSISTFITLFSTFSVKDLAKFIEKFSHWLTTFVVTKQGRCPRSSQLRKTSSFEYWEGESDMYFLFHHDHLLTLPSRWIADLEFLSNSTSYSCFLSPLCLSDRALIQLYTRGTMPNVFLQN